MKRKKRRKTKQNFKKNAIFECNRKNKFCSIKLDRKWKAYYYSNRQINFDWKMPILFMVRRRMIFFYKSFYFWTTERVQSKIEIFFSEPNHDDNDDKSQKSGLTYFYFLIFHQLLNELICPLQQSRLLGSSSGLSI